MQRWDGDIGRLAACLAEARAAGVPMPDRRLGVGKRMGDSLWLHRSALPDPGVDVGAAIAALPGGFEYDVVRLRASDRSVAFIRSADFDMAGEPTVGLSALVRPSGSVTLTEPPADPWVWHHKWSMVRPCYGGFDVAASVSRSAAWRRLVGVDRALSSRIGRRSVWEREVVPRLA